MKKQIIKGFLILTALLALNSCSSDDDNNSDDVTTISGDCYSGDTPIEIINFSLTEIETIMSDDDDFDYYRLHFSFNIKNNSSETINLDNTIVQSYISTDAILDNSDQAAGGASISYGDLAAGETLDETERTASSISLDEDALDIDGYYLLINVEFEALECELLISKKININ